MKIAVTGGTGFIGRYILRQLVDSGHQVRAWRRESSDVSGLEAVSDNLEWQVGQLGNESDAKNLIAECDAVVHAAFDRPGKGFQHSEGDLLAFLQTNILGSLQLIQAAQENRLRRFVFISSCAVHDKILDDRPLDETHPTWAASHYGAYKAAVEQFVYSFGLGRDFPICSLRPTGVYGINHPVEDSKWFDLVRRVVEGETVSVEKGGKEVHAADVAKAVNVLLDAKPEEIRGQAFNCYDFYVAQHTVATLAKRFSDSTATIQGEPTRPKNQIENGKIKKLGMRFGGESQLEETVRAMVIACRSSKATV